MSGDTITTAPEMEMMNALVVEPEGFLIPQPTMRFGGVSLGTGPIDERRRALFLGIQHRDGRTFIAALPEQLALEFADLLMTHLRDLKTGRTPEVQQ